MLIHADEARLISEKIKYRKELLYIDSCIQAACNQGRMVTELPMEYYDLNLHGILESWGYRVYNTLGKVTVSWDK